MGRSCSVLDLAFHGTPPRSRRRPPPHASRADGSGVRRPTGRPVFGKSSAIRRAFSAFGAPGAPVVPGLPGGAGFAGVRHALVALAAVHQRPRRSRSRRRRVGPPVGPLSGRAQPRAPSSFPASSAERVRRRPICSRGARPGAPALVSVGVEAPPRLGPPVGVLSADSRRFLGVRRSYATRPAAGPRARRRPSAVDVAKRRIMERPVRSGLGEPSRSRRSVPFAT